MIKTAVMGYGTIGSDVAEILDKNRGVIAGRTGQGVRLRYVLDLGEFQDSPMTDKIAHDFKVIQQGEEVRVVVGTMGGLNPVYPFVGACLMADKHVVTSDKTLVTAYGTEFLAVARGKNVSFFFEASVGGGIPVTRPLYRCLMGEHIGEIADISNGTTNFILTRVDKEGESFGNALKEAQNLGYTERNPEADAEDHNTCRKITVLIAMTTGKEVDYRDIYTEGITRITDIDFRYAEKMGTSVKLFGTSRIKDDRVPAYVAPVTINKTSPPYSVNDVFDGILIKGNMLGTSMFYGSGIGKLPISSTVAADIIEAAQSLKRNVSIGWTGEKQAIEPTDQAQFKYFVRVAGSYRNKEQGAKSAFGQVEVVEFYGMNEFTFLTAQMTEGELKKGAASYDTREWERSEYSIRQMIRVML